MGFQDYVGNSQSDRTKKHHTGDDRMKLIDIFMRRVNGRGKVQKRSDSGGLFLYLTPTGKQSRRQAKEPATEAARNSFEEIVRE